MTYLEPDIAAFEHMRPELEAKHLHAWVLFHDGAFVDAFPDFEVAATVAVERFDAGPYLIRQVGAGASSASRRDGVPAGACARHRS
jgi:hypothetical protein